MTPVRVGRGRAIHVSESLQATLCRPLALRTLIASPDCIPTCKACLRALIERR